MNLHPVSIPLLFLCFLNTFTAGGNYPTHITGDVSVNCGSTGTSAAPNGGQWLGDLQPKFSSLLQIKGSSAASTVIHKLISADPVPHKTARISLSHFSYAFQVTPGQKILRLHFNPAQYKGFKRFKDLFTVEAGPFTLLGNFSASLTAAALGVNFFAKEFCITIEENSTLDITFSPAGSQSGDSTYAFINGIEIISVPMYLSYFKDGDPGALLVGQKSVVYIENSTALELIYRLNVKRDSISSDDDFDDMMGLWTAAPKQKAGDINNLTWKKMVNVGFRYLVRIYFYELGLKMTDTGGMIFKVLINEMIVDTNTDIFKEKDDNGILRYRDYMVVMRGRKHEGKRDLLISLQSNNDFMDVRRLLKGFEIFKLSNPDNSLASPNPLLAARDSQSWTIQNLLLVLAHRNAISTVAITAIALMSIIVHKLRIVWEASITEDEYKPSTRAKRLFRRFSLAEIQSATRNFSDALIIGNGGFGKVYKGLIDNGVKTVAIKRLKPNSRQGKQEFLTEIKTLSELRHINLVSLIGYCNEHGEMILVYEYMASGTLADQLYKLARGSNNCSSLTWKQRLNICIGAGRGLDYLHTRHRVIHRDVKPSNILLDENFVAKVSDFGLAKLQDRGELETHVSTRVKGTFGYLDPHYFLNGKLTRTSDTYAFGVVLLEVLCGRPAVDLTLEEDDRVLIQWARNRINEGKIEQIIASSLIGEISPDSLKVFVGVAERCLDYEPKNRPTMAQVVLQLELALEQQESRKSVAPNKVSVADDNACPPNDETIPSVTEPPSVASIDPRTVTVPPTEETNIEIDNATPAVKKDGRKPKIYKPIRLWAWDALWNRVKPSKKKGLLSEICEADINLPKFDFDKIAAATNQFSSSNKIGQGGFGSVYKALLPTGQIVAVKTFSYSEGFKSEVLLVSNLQHRNIVKLLGYCIHREEGMLLYELMENGSLDKFIFGQCHQLQWSLRFEIIVGVAKGVLYLHQDSGLRIIHRDLKPRHILLDTQMNSKISGFGLARTIDDDQSEVETRVAGTFGYLCPEYACEGKLSEMADVYAFGIIVLETLAGRKNVHLIPETEIDLISCAWQLWNERRALDLVDKTIGSSFPGDEVLRCIQVGLLCTQRQPRHRPTMHSVLMMLLGEDMSLQDKVVIAASVRRNMEWDAENPILALSFRGSRSFEDDTIER